MSFLLLTSSFPPQMEVPVSHASIQSLLLKFSAQELIEVRQPSLSAASSSSMTPATIVTSVDHTKLCAMRGDLSQRTGGVKRKGDDSVHLKRLSGSAPSIPPPPSPPRPSSITLALPSSAHTSGVSDWKTGGGGPGKKSRTSKEQTTHLDMEIESLLNQQSTKEQQSKKVRQNMEHGILAEIWNV